MKSINIKQAYKEVKALEENNTEAALIAYSNLAVQAQEAGDYTVQTDCLLYSAKINRWHGAYYKALHQAGTALQLINLHSSSDVHRLALVYKELGAIYADGFEKISIALNYFLKGLKCNIPDLNLNFYNNIGSLYRDLGKHKESLKYLLKGKKMAATGGNNHIILAFLLENIGAVYVAINEYEKAEKTLLEAKEVTTKEKKSNNELDYIKGFIDNTLASLYFKINKEDEALVLIEEALQRAKARNHNSTFIKSLQSKSNYALQIEDDELFVQTISEAIAYTKEETMSIEQIDCLTLLKGFYWRQKDYQQACIVADQIIDVKAQIDQTREEYSVAELLEKRASEIMVLENKNRLISRQKKDLEQFAYIVAHDLKEPIRNIGSYSGLIKLRYKDRLGEEGEEFLDFILASAKHMNSMLEDLLEYVTLEADSNVIKPIKPNDIIKDILHRSKDRIEAINATIDVDDGLATSPIRRVHFMLLIENLISNAIKFRAADRPLEIRIKAIESADDICYSVSDNGSGIEANYHQSIFQIFKRLNKQKHAGTGIGLSICKKIVETYQGTIWVASKPNEGSTFYFKIPKADE